MLAGEPELSPGGSASATGRARISASVRSRVAKRVAVQSTAIGAPLASRSVSGKRRGSAPSVIASSAVDQSAWARGLDEGARLHAEQRVARDAEQGAGGGIRVDHASGIGVDREEGVADAVDRGDHRAAARARRAARPARRAGRAQRVAEPLEQRRERRAHGRSALRRPPRPRPATRRPAARARAARSRAGRRGRARRRSRAAASEAANERKRRSTSASAAPGSGRAGPSFSAIACSICCRLEISQAAISGSRITQAV